MPKDIKQEIIKILTDIEYYASVSHYIEEVIEEKEPFFWRIRKKWARETATKILSLTQEEYVEEILARLPKGNYTYDREEVIKIIKGE